jgi:hypothetical protein
MDSKPESQQSLAFSGQGLRHEFRREASVLGIVDYARVATAQLFNNAVAGDGPPRECVGTRHQRRHFRALLIGSQRKQVGYV